MEVPLKKDGASAADIKMIAIFIMPFARFFQPERHMTSIFHAADANYLLADLPTAEQDAFMASCETVSLTFGEELHHPTDTVTHAYFPITSFTDRHSSWG